MKEMINKNFKDAIQTKSKGLWPKMIEAIKIKQDEEISENEKK